MNNYFSKLIYLINNQHFSDGLRIAFAILLPALVLSNVQNVMIAFPFCLGTICVSLTDTPGRLTDRKNGMLIGCVAIFIVSILTGFAHRNIFPMGLEVIVLCFLCSMLPVYGLRTSLIGTAILLVMILLMTRHMSNGEIIRTGFLVLAGGLWYFFLSLTLFILRPFSHAEKALGELIIGIGEYVKIKSSLYKKDASFKEIFKDVINKQIKISDQQELCREQILRSKFIMHNKKTRAVKLVIAFVEIQDLYENILATHFNYEGLRKNIINKDVLSIIEQTLFDIGNELKLIGHYLETGHAKKILETTSLNEKIDLQVTYIRNNSEQALEEIILKLEKLTEHLEQLKLIITDSAYKQQAIDYGKFKLEKQSFSFQPMIENLSMNSSIFRHAIRVTVVGFAGFVIGKIIPNEGHSYWILLTSIFILKPSFSLSKQRNWERIIGTLAGAIIGYGILLFVKDKTMLFIIMALFMIAAYTVQRIQYILLILFITPYVFIIFNFLGVNVVQLMEERIVDTLIGCGLAFIGAYLILPHWESDKIKDLMRELLNANIKYFQNAIDFLYPKQRDQTAYRLARKEVFISTANFQSAYQRMKSEPSKVRLDIQMLHEFLMLNHSLSAFIAGLNTTDHLKNPATVNSLNECLLELKSGVVTVNAEQKEHDNIKSIPSKVSNENMTEESMNGLGFLREIIAKINAIVNRI